MDHTTATGEPSPVIERLEVGSEPWLDAASTLTRAIILRHWAPRSCLASTRIGIAVWDYFGLPATPRPVQVCAFSPEAAAWHDAHPGLDQASPVGWSAGCTGDGAITGSGGRGDWDGHLVMRAGGWLVDLSADQLHRPDRGLHVPGPIVGQLPVGHWRDADDDRMVTYGDGLGTVITYRAMRGPGAENYRLGNDWARYAGARKASAGQAIRAIRAVTA